jgi:membrane protease YdiL (CAAX protease family)
MTERSSRLFQLYLVLAIGFVIPVVKSLSIFLGTWHPGPATSHRFVGGITFELIGLLCLYLVLRDQKRRFRDIGLFPNVRLTDVAHSFALFFAALFSSGIFYVVLLSILGIGRQQSFDRSMIFGTTLSVLPVVYALLNPFFEELLVRAFLISEIEAIYRSTALAVCVSVGLQTSYHLYQGLPAMLSHVPTFLLFSLYFVRARRILPVILAHMFMDLYALAFYFRHLH